MNNNTYTNSNISSEEEAKRQNEYIEKSAELFDKLTGIYGHAPSACVTTFGCQMNARDSEKLIGILSKIGFSITEDEGADLVIYNTCTVRDNANQKVYGRLGQLGSMKKKNPHKLIALCGCMMQENTVIEKIKESYRFVNLIFGTHNIYKFPELIYNVLLESFNAKPRMIIDIWDNTSNIVEELPVERKYSFKSGVNIMFGCNNFCTYCIVPYVRGRERSRASADIIAEIKCLVKDGVKEVMLLGQNVNSYGKGLEENITFPELLEKIEEIEGLERIRFMTSHPKDLSDDLIRVMAKSKKICKHMHLPVQAGNNEILERMNRRYTREHYLELVRKLREAIPDLSLTTDIIVGFPGETKVQALETASLVKEVGYDNAFTFIYSKRTGTPAASMPSPISEEEINENFNLVLDAVHEASKKAVSRFEGQVLEALVEEVNSHDASLVTGRLSNNILVHFKGTSDMIGNIYKVRLTENKGFYYIGELEDAN